MKILITITKADLAGAQVNVYHLARFLSQKHEVFICAGAGHWLPEQIKSTNARYIYLASLRNTYNPFKLIIAYLELKQIIRDIKPDIVSCHSSVAGFITRLASRNIAPVVFSVHGWSFESQNGLLKYLLVFAEKALAKLSEEIICESNYLYDLSKKYKISDLKKITIIRNGIEIYNKKIEKASIKFKYIFIGRLSKQKDAGLLIRAFIQLPEKIKDKVVLNILGDGDQKTKLQEYVNKNMAQNIFFLGQKSRSEMFQYLKKSDCLVLTTNWEGMPYTILEAMAHELPVIASNVGSIHEVINKKTGILIPRGEEKPLLTALLKVFTEKEKYKKIGKTNKQLITKLYNLETMCTKTEKLFINCIAKNVNHKKGF